MNVQLNCPNCGAPITGDIGFNGLFDNRKRFELFKANGIQMLVPRGRMRFVHKEHGLMKSPVFQSIYICSRVLDSQIVFSDSVF